MPVTAQAIFGPGANAGALPWKGRTDTNTLPVWACCVAVSVDKGNRRARDLTQPPRSKSPPAHSRPGLFGAVRGGPRVVRRWCVCQREGTLPVPARPRHAVIMPGRCYVTSPATRKRKLGCGAATSATMSASARSGRAAGTRQGPGLPAPDPLVDTPAVGPIALDPDPGEPVLFDQSTVIIARPR